MNRRRTILVPVLTALGLLAGCGHARPADPNAAPAPWPTETAPPPAREPLAATTTQSTSPPAPAAVVEAAHPARDAEIPGEGPPRPFVVSRPERTKLTSGTEVLLVRRTRLPLATILVVWPQGAGYEPTDRAGLAALTADLLTQGAGTRTALQLAAELQRLGARLSTQASWDSTSVSLTTLTRALDPALALLADVVLRPRFEPAEIERVRGEARTTLLQLGDQAASQAGLAGARTVYGRAHRYSELVQGSTSGLSAITREELLAWHRDRLHLSRATVIVVGDVEMKALRPRLEKLFGVRTVTPTATRPAVAEITVPAPARRVVLVDRPGAAQTEVRAYQAGPPRSSSDYFPLLVLNTIFGGNFSSRLNAKLREEKGYTYGARSDFAFRREGGPFSAGAPVKTAVTRAALVDLLAELERLRAGAVTERELTTAKQTLVRSLARAFETPPEVAGAIAALRVYRLPEDYFATYAQKIAAVTAADLARVARTLQPEQMSLIFVGDEKLIGADIRSVVGPYERPDVAAAPAPGPTPLTGASP